MIFPHFIVNILHCRACYLVTLVQSFRIFYKFEFQSYHKIVETAITHASHHGKATDIKTGDMLTEKLCKQNINQKK